MMEDLCDILLDLVREGRVYQALIESSDGQSIKFCESILGNVIVLVETGDDTLIITGDDTLIGDDELPDMDTFHVTKVHVETNDSDPLNLPDLDNSVEYNIFSHMIEV